MPMQDGKPSPPPAGDQLALKMLEVLLKLSAQLEVNARLAQEYVEKMDDLIGHFEVIEKTMDILTLVKDKGKIDMRDFATAYTAAADEVFGEDEDEPGEGDPLVEQEA